MNGFGDRADPAPVNTDGDANANYRDLDSNANGTFDIDEAGNGNLDNGAAVGDGRVDSGTDNDRDGIISTADGNDTIFGDTPFVALPVSFLSFTAYKQNQDVLLKWITVEESNNWYFSVQRSKDGKTFEEIGRVTGNNQTDQLSTYQFMDTDALVGVSYYLIVQIDWDSTVTISRIASVRFETILRSLVYPNPTYTDAILSIDSKTEAPLSFKLTDMSGKILDQWSLFQPQGLQTYPIPLGKWASGTYILQVRLLGEEIHLKVVKY